MPISLAIAGCGSRGHTYASLAARLAPRYRITAAADPRPDALGRVLTLAGPTAAAFPSVEELLAVPRLADVLVLANQDRDHFAPALRALRHGYDLLLEKPAATSPEEIRILRDEARALGRRIMVCFVLRFSPFYGAIRAFLDSGDLGRLVTIQASEGVGTFHQAHSYVRGHWSRTADSSPMILAKSSHDLDLLHWFAGAPCRTLSSFGRLSYFRPDHAPSGAPPRCTDGCPLAPTCPYDAHRYLTDMRRWLGMLLPDGSALPDAAILDFLRTSPWGRCVWHCDNDAVDHQVVACEFENEVTATFTMTAFDTGRSITIHGTEGVLRGRIPPRGQPGEGIFFTPHHRGDTRPIPLPPEPDGGYAGHGGGDFGILDALDHALAGTAKTHAFLDDTAEAHFMAFAAESSRLSGGAPVAVATLRHP